MTTDPRELLVFRYMTRFACLGGACEDTCCSTWNVSVDRLHLDALARRMEQAGERDLFDRTFTPRPPDEQRPWAHATIRMRESDGRCPLLGADGLCDVHRRWGDEALPDVCSFFPRHLTEVEGRAELGGSLSCPEVARQALLPTDGLDLLLFEGEEAAALAGRTPVLQRPSADREAVVDELRGVAWLILDGAAPLRHRLCQLAFVADEAESILESEHAGALAGEVEPLLEPEALAGMAAELDALPGPSEAAAGLLLAQVVRLRSVVRAPLRDEIDRVLEVAVGAGLFVEGREAGDGETGKGWSVAPGFVAAHRRRLGELPADVVASVESWLGRLLRERIFRDLARPAATLSATTRRLALRLCALRLLLLLHPLAVEGTAPLSAWLVRLVSGVARVADHDTEVRDFLDEDAGAHLGSLTALLGLLPLL